MATIYGMTVTFGGSSGSSGSVTPQVTVTAPTGSTVTATKGDVTLTAKENSGVWVFDLPEFGTWAIIATDGIKTATQSVVFEGAKAVTLSYFAATIAVTYPAGSTCTCSNGATVLTAPDTSGSCTFIVTGTGIWTVTSTDGDNYATTDVEIVNDGQAATAALAYKPVASTAATDGVSYTNGLAGLDAATVSLFAEAISNNSEITRVTSAVYIDYGTTHRKICVGDQVSLSLNGTSYDFDVIGFNHDTLTTPTAYGEATATVLAGMTLQMHDLFATGYKMNADSTNVGGWKSSNMRTATMPKMFNALPDDWRAIIKPVNKITGKGGGSANGVETVSDNCFLLSEEEIFGSGTAHSVDGEGARYAYYKAGNSTVKYQEGTASRWWERSPWASSTVNFCDVTVTGTTSYRASSYIQGVAFAFCV